MIGLVWVMLTALLAIWLLSLGSGRTELKGNPFDSEDVRRPMVTASRTENKLPAKRTVASLEEPASPQETVGEPQALAQSSEAPSLMQAIVLAEILAPPRAKHKRRPR